MKMIKVIEKILFPLFQDVFPLNIRLKNHKINELFKGYYIKFFNKFYNKEEILNIHYKEIDFKILSQGIRGSIDMDLILFGIYEKEITNIFLDNIKGKDLFIDIGGNIGYYSLLVSSVTSNIPIYTFEPIKETFDILSRNIKLNNFNNIKLFNIALGNEEKDIEINLKRELGHNSIVSDKNINSGKKEIVKIRKGNQLISDITQKNILIKIDVEGFEFEALKGIENIISNNDCTIIIEYTPIFFKKLTNNIDDYCIEFLNFFKYKGYNIYDIEKDFENIYDIDLFVKNFKKIQTNLFIKKIK